MAILARLPSLFEEEAAEWPSPAPESLPLYNTRAEQSFLGALLANNKKVFEAVAETLRPEHFYDPLHGDIYEECSFRIAAGESADAVTLRHWFQGHPLHKEVGDGYIPSLLSAMVGIVNAKDYARLTTDLWKRRNMVEIAERLKLEAGTFDTRRDCARIISDATTELDIIGALGRGGHSSATMLEAIDMAVSAGERTAGGTMSGINTGFRPIDRRLGGMEGGAMYVLAARPGMGKTALAVQIGMNAAEEGIGVAYISLEMQRAQIGRRALAWAAGIPQKIIRQGGWTESQAQRIIEARNRYQKLPMTIDDQSGANVAQIALKARLAQRKHGLGLIIVDHLHIIGQDTNVTRMGATWGISQVSNGLKRLAKDMGIPILALAQLKRLEGRDDKRPTLEDLRQSGEIEQDAESVMFIYRDEYYLGNTPPGHHPPHR